MVMVMVNVDLYSAIITKVSNALDTLVSGEKPVCCRFITESERVKKFFKIGQYLGGYYWQEFGALFFDSQLVFNEQTWCIKP